MTASSPYATAIQMGHAAPAHILNTEDAERIQAYDTYWNLFHNDPEAFVAVMRDDAGNEISRRLVPSMRTIIEATNRYLGKDLTFIQESIEGVELDESTLAAHAEVRQAFDDLLTREEFYAKYLVEKRYMLVRGDACLHVLADSSKPEGTRLRIVALDPSRYFPIEDPNDSERLLGAYIVTLVDDEEASGTLIAQRQEYRKTENGTIFTRLRFFELDGWDDRAPFSEEDLAEVSPPSRYTDTELLAGYELPSLITTIPVYHWRNNRNDQMRFGTSEVQGLESLFTGINQTASDQDITVVLAGIGVYVTTSGKPRDAQGNERDWTIGPASVLEMQSKDDTFTRVPGVTSIQPLLDHTEYLESKALQTSGTPDIATGRLQVGAASSGVSLLIQMAPVISKNEEKEVEIKSKLDQMAFDLLNMWFPAFEGIDPRGLRLQATFGDALPLDRAATLAEIIALKGAQIISAEFAAELVRDKLGIEIPAGMMDAIISEQTRLLDAVGARIDTEANAAPEGGTE